MKNLETILYIDDDVNITKIAEVALVKVGKFDLTICHCGLEAIELVKSQNFDLILLDVMMPKISGPETFKQFQTMPNFSTPVVFLTGKDDPDEIKSLLDQGANSVITKPFNPMELSVKLNQIWKTINE